MAIIVEEPELITFIHLKRTGGTSVSTWLTHYANGRRVVGKHLNLRKTKSKIQDVGFSFATVRNPWDRCVSAYFYTKRKIIERQQKIKNGHTRKFKPHEVQETIEQFNPDFSSWLLENETHWSLKPQIIHLHDIDYVMKFENLDEDFKLIQEKIGNYTPLPKKNTSSHANYRKYYTPETIELVQEKCHEDIVNYGYEF